MPVKDVLIAVDQLINTFAGGRADETISARAWRLHKTSRGWNIVRRLVDGIFFWDSNHCYKSYCAEIARKHLPNEYQK